MEEKIKVAWICHLSNTEIRRHLKFSQWSPTALLKKMVGKESYFDFAQWNINAI